MLAPACASAPETAATISSRSAHEISRRAIGGGPAGGPAGTVSAARVLASMLTRCIASEHRSDLALERGDVLAQDVAGEGSLARGDRVQDVVVLVNAREQMRQPVEHEVPDPQREVEVPAERLL